MASEPSSSSENPAAQNLDDHNQDLFAGVHLDGNKGSTDDPELPGLNPASGLSGSFFNEATSGWEEWASNPISPNSWPYSVVGDPGRPPVSDAPQPRANNSRPALADPQPPLPVRNPLPSAWAHVFTLISKLEKGFNSRIEQIKTAVEAAILEQNGQSATVLPADITNPFDLSRDTRLGVKALLRAQKAFRHSQPLKPRGSTVSRHAGHVAPRDLIRPMKTPPSPSGVKFVNYGVNAAPFAPIQSTNVSLPRSGASDHSRYLPEPPTQPTVNLSPYCHSLAAEFDAFGNFQSSAPDVPGYSGSQSNVLKSSSTAATAEASHPTRKAETDDSAGRRRKASRGSQASAVDDSTPLARPSVSARSNGPTDVIEGMARGSGADRLLALQRASLPKGNVNGKDYCCEAKCGYDDDASLLVNCDSSYHRKQPRLKLHGGEVSDRGWYHRPCGGLPLNEEPPRTWLCPPCVQRGTVSTNDHDQDDDGDDDQDEDSGPDGEDDSGDEYKPGKDTPNEESDDDNGGKHAREDSSKNGKVKGRDKGSKKTGSKNRKRYILDSDDDDDNDDDEQNNNQSGNLASSQRNQEQLNGRGSRNRRNLDDDNDTGTEEHPTKTKHRNGRKRYILDSDDDETGKNKPPSTARSGRGREKIRDLYSNTEADVLETPAKTHAGAIWNEEEKVMAIDFMRDIVREGKISGEARFAEIARRMHLKGHQRGWTSVKNAWNRGLRERSGIDERKNKKAPLTTSRQDGESKRRSKENRGRSTSETNVQASSTTVQASSTTAQASPTTVQPSPTTVQTSSTTIQPSPNTVQPSSTTIQPSPNTVQQSRTTKSESPKRQHQPEDGDDGMPPKRRRSSP